MQQLIIRKACEKDIPQLEMLFKITREKTFTSAPPNSFQLEDYKKLTCSEEVWVAESDDKILGFISLWIQDNFIHHLFVHPDYQGCGIGTELLFKAEEHLSRPMELKVAMGNDKALRFYAKHGWGIVSHHHDKHEPYILLRKS